ncbi:MAG: T9SS type A sorting domain-containing protein [Rhodothermales bacterium]|nr:T9SS type A sorting domain-containing protein [Rhodothermales bacterium]
MNRLFLLFASSLLFLTSSIAPSFDARAQKNASSVPPLYEGSLFQDDQGVPARKGGSVAVLADSNLHLIVYFAGLRLPWSQIDLFDGDPRSGGTLYQNLAIGVPGTTSFSGGLKSVITLTPDEIGKLDAGELFLQVLPNSGSQADIAVGNIQPSVMTEPTLLESVLYRDTHARPVEHGSILAVQQGQDIHLTLYFANLTSPWTSIDLFRGSQTDDGELVKNLGLNFAVAPESSFGLATTLTLSESEIQDMKDGLMFIRVLAQQPDSEVRGQILLHPNLAPGQSEMISPIQGETIVIGGDASEDPISSEEVLLTVSLTNTVDPDGNPVRYFWQISRHATFSLGVTYTVDLGIGITSRDFTVGEIAEIYDATWTGFEAPAFTPVTYYVRALTTDGAAFTFGETESANLVRGKVTANEPEGELPTSLTLHGNYPNPFNPSTTVVFDLPRTADVRLKVFNVLGQSVIDYAPGIFGPGDRLQLNVDGSSLPSGIYYYQISAGTGSQVLVGQGQMVLLK